LKTAGTAVLLARLMMLIFKFYNRNDFDINTNFKYFTSRGVDTGKKGAEAGA
jgi:hypothetical protein